MKLTRLTQPSTHRFRLWCGRVSVGGEPWTGADEATDSVADVGIALRGPGQLVSWVRWVVGPVTPMVWRWFYRAV